ncbi:Arginase/deacetylase, partial [Meira miltonrushii]
VYIAPEVLGHRWVRSRSTAYIVERPERLRASLLGLSALIGKSFEHLSHPESIAEDQKVDALTDSIASVSIAQSFGKSTNSIQALISRSKVSLANPNKGLLSVHGCEEGSVTLDEIGDEPAYSIESGRGVLSEVDLLRQGSQGAIEASLGACCMALDRIVQHSHLHLSKSSVNRSTPSSIGRRAFVLARPPGHHCSSKNPSGFCWVNNVAVVAAEAYAKHGIDRIAILDFDLHHGDGTQSIVWRINEETSRLDADREARKNRWSTLLGRRGLKMFYGSLHDIESFPCEDGNKQKVSDASIRLEGGHGQWIWNIHLDCHANRDEFLSAYEKKYKDLIKKAQEFFENTQSTSQSSMVIISAGFDACVHETPGMQRHGKNVPTEFYTIFTRDSVRLAENFCDGKLMSVLEGGYSDRALTTGVISHLAGMTDDLKEGMED